MKAKDFVEKYNLHEVKPTDKKFDRKHFFIDLRAEYLRRLEQAEASKHVDRLILVTKDFESVFEGIDNKIPYKLPKSVRNFFYATTVCRAKEELFLDWVLCTRPNTQKFHEVVEWLREDVQKAINNSNLHTMVAMAMAGFFKWVHVSFCPNPTVETFKTWVKVNKVHFGFDESQFDDITVAAVWDARDELIPHKRSRRA